MLSLGYCILGVMLCITTFFLAKKHPNRISNGFILELAVILLLESLLGLTAAHMGASPWLMGVAYVLAYIRPVLFVILGFALLVNGVIGVRREGFSLTSALPFAWGIMLLLSGYWFLWGPGAGHVGLGVLRPRYDLREHDGELHSYRALWCLVLERHLL